MKKFRTDDGTPFIGTATQYGIFDHGGGVKRVYASVPPGVNPRNIGLMLCFFPECDDPFVDAIDLARWYTRRAWEDRRSSKRTLYKTCRMASRMIRDLTRKILKDDAQGTLAAGKVTTEA